MFTRKRGKTKFMYYPMTASTIVHEGTLMALSSGLLIIATATTPGHDIVGVLRHRITAADADYATSGRMVEVEVPVEKCVEWEADALYTGTTPVIGYYYDIIAAVPAATDFTVAGTVNQAGSTYDIARVVGVIKAPVSATVQGTIRVVLNIGTDGKAKT